MRNLLNLFVIGATAAALFASSSSGLAEAKRPPAKLQADDAGCTSCVSQAAALFAGGASLEAASLLRKWSGKCPHNSQLHLMLSTVLTSLGPEYLKEAEEAAAAAATAGPDQVATHFQYGITLMANDKSMRAARELEKVLDLDPGNYDAWQALATVYGKLKEADKQESCARNAAALEPATVNAKLAVIINLKKQGKIDRAQAHIRKLIESESTTPEFLQNVATLALSVGAYPEALEASERIVKFYPNAKEAFHSKAMAELMTHDYQGCLNTTGKILKTSPTNPVIRSIEGLALLNLGRQGEAGARFSQALKQSPDLAIALFGLGSLQLKQGNTDKATKYLEDSLAHQPQPGIEQLIFFTLAQTSEKTGKVDDSLDYYRESLLKGLSGKDAESARQAIKRLGGIEYNQK